MFPLCSIPSRGDQSASAASLQIMNSATTTLPLRCWRFICVFSALMLLNYTHDDCRFATDDYLPALKTFHTSILTLYSKYQPVKSRRQPRCLFLKQKQMSLWNQSTIISLDWLNTFRIYFCTNRSLVHWCVRRQV